MSNRFSHNYIKGYPQQVYIYTVHARYNKASNAPHSSTLAIYDRNKVITERSAVMEAGHALYC